MQLNQQVRHVFKVVDIVGAVVTGLVTGNFTLTLQRESSGSLVSASETVSVTEIGSGLYWVDYTPTADVGVYYLTIAHATHIVDPASFQDDVESGFAASSGPYLTTRENVRKATNKKAADDTYTTAHDDDGRIDMLLAAVTDFAQTYCARDFFSATVTEYPLVAGARCDVLNLGVYPVTSVTTVHVSTDLPRSYGADELLTADEDYILLESSGALHRVDGGTWPTGPKTVKVVYVSGYATIPADLEWAAIETIAFSLEKAKAKQYHLTSDSMGEGSTSGYRFDIPDTARRVFDLYRDRSAA